MKSIRKFRFRFSLRSLLLFMLAVSLFLATFILQVVMPSQQESRRIKLISSSIPSALVYTEPRGQFAIRHLLGDRFSERVVHMHLFSPDVTDAWITEHLIALKHIETLSIHSPNVTEKSLAKFERLPNLMVLNLVDTKISEAAINEFRVTKATSLVQLGKKLPDGSYSWLPGIKE